MKPGLRCRRHNLAPRRWFHPAVLRHGHGAEVAGPDLAPAPLQLALARFAGETPGHLDLTDNQLELAVGICWSRSSPSSGNPDVEFSTLFVAWAIVVTGPARSFARCSSTCWPPCSSVPRRRASAGRAHGLDRPRYPVRRRGPAHHVPAGLQLLLFSAFIRSIPVELEESARLDGCSTLQTFRKVVLPLLSPMAATVSIFAFLRSWNDFMMPQLITANPNGGPSRSSGPVPDSPRPTQRGLRGVSRGLAPTLVAFLIAQRWAVSSIMRSSIK